MNFPSDDAPPTLDEYLRFIVICLGIYSFAMCIAWAAGFLVRMFLIGMGVV